MMGSSIMCNKLSPHGLVPHQLSGHLGHETDVSHEGPGTIMMQLSMFSSSRTPDTSYKETSVDASALPGG